MTVFLPNPLLLLSLSSCFKLSKVLLTPEASGLGFLPDIVEVSLFNLDFCDSDLDLGSLFDDTPNSPKPSNEEATHCVAFCNDKILQRTKIFQYCTCPAGRATYNFHSPCKHNVMHLPFKSVCNKEVEHMGVICNYMTSLSYSSQSTRPTGRVLWEELLVLSRFHP